MRSGPTSSTISASMPLAGFSPGFHSELLGLKAFLFRHMYRHPRVMQVMSNAQKALADLFGRFGRAFTQRAKRILLDLG